MERKHKKIIVETSRIILGLVFVFSGFVKAVDPWGGAYKILDYFTAFEFTEYGPWAIPLSFFQAALEFGVGVCLLLGIYRRISSILILLIMLFMTPLTLYLAIANPVSDCGCFGDALVITNWQTFYKNIILLIAAIIVYFWYRLMTPFFTKRAYTSAISWICLFIFGVAIYCYFFLPVFDFRPYKIGTNIPEKMEVPKDAEHDVYEVQLIYSKDGREKKFTMDNYPKNDSTWTFVDSKSRMIKEGYRPPIHDFSITNAQEDDITDEVLSNPSYTFLLISHRLKEAEDTNVDEINRIYDFSVEKGYDFYALTASLPGEIQGWIENSGAEYPFCTTDEITLKTIIRSNPGLVLIKNGTIINMWSNFQLPDITKLNKLIDETNQGKMIKVHNFFTLFFLTVIFILPLVGLYFIDVTIFKKMKKNRRRHRRKHGHRHGRGYGH